MQKILGAIKWGREEFQRARKAAVPAVAALGLIVGTDSPTYINVVLLLVALGVYALPNRSATKTRGG
jgi:hypothetical protein